ncbi:MAG: hypothetical protein ACO1N9_12515 [Flavobacterium sp.]
MRPYYLLIILNLIFTKSPAQEFNPKINKDSLYQVVLKSLPEEKKAEFSELYKTGNKESQEFLLFMLSMPRSSKANMIANLEKNKDKINLLREEYGKLVPPGYNIDLEFEPANVIMNMPLQINLHIHIKDKKTEYNYDLQYGSKELRKCLKKIGWTEDNLFKIKKLLDDAGCVSIQNENEYYQIGFARSGMGMYLYRFFNDKNEAMKAEYNTGCYFIYYKGNIVLEWASGAVGPECFPDLT